MPNPKIIVSGATGFIGRHLVRRLVRNGYNITALGRNKERAKSFDWYDQVEFVRFDYHKDPLPFDTLSDTSLIHLAWEGLPNYASHFHFEENLPKSYQFIKSLIERNVADILVVGTCLEYGMVDGPVASDRTPAPSNSYAFAKDCLRRQLGFLQKEQSFSLKWPRLFYMYGDGQNENSILSQLDRAIDNGDEFFNMSGGDQLRDYLPIEKVVKGLVDVFEQPKQGTFNVCSGTPISIKQLVENHVAERGASIRLNLGFYPYTDYEPMAFWGKSDA